MRQQIATTACSGGATRSDGIRTTLIHSKLILQKPTELNLRRNQTFGSAYPGLPKLGPPRVQACCSDQIHGIGLAWDVVAQTQDQVVTSKDSHELEQLHTPVLFQPY